MTARYVNDGVVNENVPYVTQVVGSFAATLSINSSSTTCLELSECTIRLVRNTKNRFDKCSIDVMIEDGTGCVWRIGHIGRAGKKSYNTPYPLWSMLETHDAVGKLKPDAYGLYSDAIVFELIPKKSQIIMTPSEEIREPGFNYVNAILTWMAFQIWKRNRNKDNTNE